ncbi:hypothetical protein IFR35_10520 [Pseudomonas fluorescens]|uniref:hypothetical protein n=1 Tax=Pseudomonas fluorescens group TaxID=136843 RepID=UPI000F4739CB|nr:MULTISPECIES: hypothetical protein [Pseudomonas fluorescens group]MBD8192305.1 hypothetical protein [Pseudomonas fluorescens]MBD8226929.1 hypothetical protein [Pseudomonas fluorescens]MBD8784642.1 hypothetical protein [Pseudomonas fluorescens]MBD8817322.1 hypothetical protein [Pseudomonas fluorescens]ROM51669.1 hypothetical protein BK650_23980 [Pseudomonas rhodesiae]
MLKTIITKPKKFDVRQLAYDAFRSAAVLSKDKTYSNHRSSKYFIVSNYTTGINVANAVFEDYFKSDEYTEARAKKIHIIDLDEYDYDFAAIKLCVAKAYKPVSSLSQTKKYTDYLASDIEKNATNKVNFDPAVWEVFIDKPETDFFKYQEIRREYVVRISLVKNGRVFKKIKCNIGYFTLIAGSKPYDYQEVESEEKKATRQSLFNPCFELGGVEFMAVFNDKIKHYRDLVDWVKY